jgi:retron-type reverse transcriptase
LDGRKAIGIDGINKEMYGKNLTENIADLIDRMKRMAYHPSPVRQVLIPKEGKPGTTRPLGISNFEDKIVQKMTHKILEAVYEPTFLNSSHGFRPNRGCHTAIKDLSDHLYTNEIETVIDIDLKNFFGTIDHQILEEILKERIKDFTFMRYISRMFKAGVLAEGDISKMRRAYRKVRSPVQYYRISSLTMPSMYGLKRWLNLIAEARSKSSAMRTMRSYAANMKKMHRGSEMSWEKDLENLGFNSMRRRPN